MEKLGNSLKNYFSTGPKAVFVIVLFAMCMTITLFSMKKTLVLIVDGKTMEVTTIRSSIGKVLSDNNIAIGPKDKVSLNLNSSIKNGDKVTIKKAVDILVDVDGKELKIQSAEKNIDSMLSAEKIKVSADDKIFPAKSELLAKGLKVVIVRVDARTQTKFVDVAFNTVTQNDDNMGKGETKVAQDGKNGMTEYDYKVIYEDGKEVSRQLIKETIVSVPVDKIVAMGTLGVLTPSRGTTLYYTKSLNVKATAYSSDYASTGKNPGDYGFGITSTGARATRNVDGYSSIAVDPRVIPLGTRVYIPGYGCAIAQDVGSGIKGNSVDVYYNYESQARNWGVKWLTIYILK